MTKEQLWSPEELAQVILWLSDKLGSPGPHSLPEDVVDCIEWCKEQIDGEK